MSRIRRLSIRGIRNFDDDSEGPMIKFSRPLTLILGPNGTGKTTIIECLKYALSGEFPPGSSAGKSFIHDPMLKKLRSIQVRGSVKAEIVDCTGDLLTVSRTIEATRFEQNVRFKTLDSSLTRVNKKNKEKTTLSNRCAMVDIEMMTSMGVSKAILNYVLFCHQDDANWPFDSGKKLKERFDEIFDTTRYNKALECIRKQIKDRQADTRVLFADKRGLSIVVEEVKSKENKLKNFESRRKEAQERICDLSKKLEPINQALARIKRVETEYGEWRMEMEKMKMEYKLVKEQIDSLKREIREPYSGSTANLQDDIESFEGILHRKNDEISEIEHVLREISEKEARGCSKIAERRIYVGSLRQRMLDQRAKVAQRNETLSNVILMFGLSDNIESDVSEADAHKLINKLEEELRQMERNIEATRARKEREEEQMRQRVDLLRADFSKADSQLTFNRNEMAQIKNGIRTNRQLLMRSGSMENKLNDIDTRLAEANKKLEEYEKNLQIESLKRKIIEAAKKEETYEHERTQIEKEISVLRQQSDSQLKLESYESELAKKETEMQLIREKHGETLKMLLGKTDFAEENMTENVNKMLTVLNDRVQNLRKELDKVQYEAMTLATSVKHSNNELENRISEVETEKELVSRHCDNYNNYDDVLALKSKRVKELQDEKAMSKYRGIVYKDYIKKLNESKPCCPLCHRGFQDTQEVAKLVTELKSDLGGQRWRNIEEELLEQQKKHDTLLQLRPVVDKIHKFERVEVTKMRQEVDNGTKRLVEVRQKVQQLRESMVEPEKRLNVCKDMVGDMALWDRCASDIRNIKNSAAELREFLREGGVTLGRTINEAQTEQEKLSQLLRDIRRDVKTFQSTLDTKNEELRRATENRTELLEAQVQIHKDMRDVKKAKEILEELSLKESSLIKCIRDLEEDSIKINEQLQIADKDLEAFRNDFRSSQAAERNTIRECSKAFDNLQSIHTEVRKFHSQKIADELKITEEKLESAERVAAELKEMKALQESKLSTCKRDIITNDTAKRNLVDNLTLRRRDKEAEILKNGCLELKDKLKATNYAELPEERERLRVRRDETERERNIVLGNDEELERNVTQLTLELEKSEYRLARTNYISKCVDLATSRKSIDDLITYSKVLDAAMIDYHEERMSTVNKIMKKLWDLIYKGTDTTSIQIRTDATAVGDKKRQFNYKLVQIKHGTEMDMKGRCSAGQKVLASIILRLALAETFCEKCGVLALDEPTTNLDEDNAKSLADALHSYVHRRAKFQKNFQLIIITHDENFIPKLGQLSSNNSYYELYRFDSGLTGIRKVSLNGPTGMTRENEIDSSEEEGMGMCEGLKKGSKRSAESSNQKRAKKKHVFEDF